MNVFNYNQTAANDLINEVVTIFGNGTIPPELIKLLKEYFNFGMQNNECFYNSMCVNAVGQTTNYSSGAFNLTECINCPNEASFIDNVCTCPQNQTLFNQTCQCAPTFIRNSNNASQCLCPANSVYNGTCNCLPGFARDPNSGRCVCPPGYQLNNGTCVPLSTESGNCVCPENEFYDYILKKCRCIDGYFRDQATGHCLIV